MFSSSSSIASSSSRSSRPRCLTALASGQKEVTLLDYGAGNIRSIRNAIKKLGYSIKDVRAFARRPARAAPCRMQCAALCGALRCFAPLRPLPPARTPSTPGSSTLPTQIHIHAEPFPPPRRRRRRRQRQTKTKQVEKPSDIAAADKLVFPGVGSYGQAMTILRQRGYVQPLVDYIHVREEGGAAAAAVIRSRVGSAAERIGGRAEQWQIGKRQQRRAAAVGGSLRAAAQRRRPTFCQKQHNTPTT